MEENKNIPEFGIKRANEERRDGGCGVVFDPETQKYAVGRDEKGCLRLFSGGVNPGEDIKDGVLREVREESGLYDFLYIEKIGEVVCHFHNNLKNVDRVANATCFLIILKSSKLIPTELEEHEKFVLDWATPEELIANWQGGNENKDYDHWVYFMKKSVARAIELAYDKTSTIKNC